MFRFDELVGFGFRYSKSSPLVTQDTACVLSPTCSVRHLEIHEFLWSTNMSLSKAHLLFRNAISYFTALEQLVLIPMHIEPELGSTILNNFHIPEILEDCYQKLTQLFVGYNRQPPKMLIRGFPRPGDNFQSSMATTTKHNTMNENGGIL
ncbi:hypothetical protein G7Y89_g9033 [Cudoniella acicularis]|uniref:Uncharacterized protein n=1 Tax=Cudoniella acicularis TaxID=354080 RepID=A0A8H4W012_9HELO|nr:hypothetical protein G7Y89_g9033 [Cudoniella acicularis]